MNPLRLKLPRISLPRLITEVTHPSKDRVALHMTAHEAQLLRAIADFYAEHPYHVRTADVIDRHQFAEWLVRKL
jgi:hypothetical protein